MIEFYRCSLFCRSLLDADRSMQGANHTIQAKAAMFTSTSGTYTPAVINNTCLNVYRADRDVMMICQTKATAQGTGGNGDSGAPVFKITDSPDDGDVNLYGIVWGGSSTDILYSSVQQIQHSSELGTLRSCDSSLTC